MYILSQDERDYVAEIVKDIGQCAKLYIGIMATDTSKI